MSTLSQTLRASILDILAHYGEARFPDQAPIEAFELDVEGPSVIVSLRAGTVRGRISAPMLLAAEVWGFHVGRLHGSRAMLEPAISQNGDVEEILDRTVGRALSRAGLAWIDAGQRQEGLFCLARGLGASGLLIDGPESEKQRLEALEDEIFVESELDDVVSRSTTPNALAKRAAPFAEHGDPFVRWSCARTLISGLWHLSSSNRLTFNRHIGPALQLLAQDPVPAVREDGLRALDYLTWKLWCKAAYAEILPHLEVLIDAEFHTDLQLWRVWEARLAEGDDAGAEAAWQTLGEIGDPGQTVRLAANAFEYGDWTDARIVGLGRVARAHWHRARGSDPCADRLRRKKTLKPPKAEVRARLLRRGRECVDEALELARPRMEQDLKAVQESPEASGARGFSADLYEIAALLDLEQGCPAEALRSLIQADALDQALGLTWRRGRFDAKMRELVQRLSPEDLKDLDLPERIVE